MPGANALSQHRPRRSWRGNPHCGIGVQKRLLAGLGYNRRMGSEDLDRIYLDRTHKLSEKNALPEIFQTLLSGGMYVLDGSFDPSMLAEKVEYLRERLASDVWSEKGTLTFDLRQTFPGAQGTFTVEYDSEIDENLTECLKKYAYPEADLETLRTKIREQYKDYRRIKKVSLASGTHVFNLREHVPANWSLYAYTKSDARLIQTAFANPEFRFIMSPQPIDSRIGIHQLLHEVGHVVVDKEKTPEEIAEGTKRSQQQTMTTSEKTMLIRLERDVNAFALDQLRHFFGPEDIETFRQLSYTALRAYHRGKLTTD